MKSKIQFLLRTRGKVAERGHVRLSWWLQLRLQKRLSPKLTTNNTPTKNYSHPDDKPTRSNSIHGFKPFALKGQFNLMMQMTISSTVSMAQLMWLCCSSSNVLVSEKWIDCTWGEIQSTNFENTLSRDKDVQTAAISFTALKILMWKKKLSRTNLATVYSK